MNRCFKFFTCLLLALKASLCCYAQKPNITYPGPQTYTNTPITPVSPANTGGAIPAGSGYAQVTTFAGSGASGATNGAVATASFNVPTSIVMDAAGNFYISDTNNNQIREINTAGQVTTFAGAFAQLSAPAGLCIDVQQNIYVADAGNNVIKKITPAGVVSVFAGSGGAGFVNGVGPTASFNQPSDVVADPSGNIYVVDAGNNVIRKITPGGLVSTFAGDGAAGATNGLGVLASFNAPKAVAIDGSLNLYITDSGNNLIRKITPAGQVSTLAGTGTAGATNGPAGSATFTHPAGLTVDQLGNVYIADVLDNQIRQLNNVPSVSTLAGNTSPGSVNGIGASASFFDPTGVIADDIGSLYVADAANNLIRKISLTGYSITPTLPAGLAFNTGTGVISGTPVASSPPTVYTIIGYNTSGSSTATITIQVLTGTTPQTITFPPLPSQVVGNPDLAPGATSTNNTIPVTYTSSNPSVATIVNGQIHMISSGTTIITATQAGNATYSPATPVSQPLTVTAAYLIFNAIAPVSICAADFSPGAVSNAPITYTVANDSVVSIINGKIHINNHGTVLITATNGTTSLGQELTIDSLQVYVSVNVTPIDYTVCLGTTATFTAHAVNGGNNPSYEWLLNGGGTILPNADSTITLSDLKPGDQITCIVTNHDYCAPVPSKKSLPAIVINQGIPYTTVSVALPPTVCAGDPITFTASTTNANANSVYQWQVNGRNEGSNSPTFSSVVNNGDIVTCTVSNTTGCILTVTSQDDTVKTYPLPVIKFPNPSIEEGLQVQLNPTITGDIATYQWSPAAGLSSTTIPNPVASPVKTTLYTLDVTSTDGCSASGAINVVSEILPPNTFTPNGDGINDFWDIPRLVYFPDCNVSIFTRAGSMVYHSIGYPKPWDGRYNDSPLPDGVYYYVISFTDGTATVAGWVAILR
jgi:gliding motility-associated-like protein